MDGQKTPAVVLFGYDSSPFTQKIRLALRLKQVPYTFMTVPPMMPRPLLRDFFHLTYRKIPVLAIGRDVYCDTSIILEALEHIFCDGFRTLYPPAADGRTNRALIRGFASYWTDRPLFRVTTGLIPSSVWRTAFGNDRAALIGHKLDPDKLESKLPRNLSSLDLQLSLLEPQLTHNGWIFSTETPSLADISLFYQLDWARAISAGRGIHNLTGGGTADTHHDIIGQVFNAERYPNIWAWFHRFGEFTETLWSTETRITSNVEQVLKEYLISSSESSAPLLLASPRDAHTRLDAQTGLQPGIDVSVAPDDTGRDDPTLGQLLALSPEEIVIKPHVLASARPLLVNVRLHFPRLGFVALPIRSSKL